MIDLPLHLFSESQPSDYQEIIITDGQYFRSGTWILVGDEGHFIPDPNRPIKCIYWIPKPILDQ